MHDLISLLSEFAIEAVKYSTETMLGWTFTTLGLILVSVTCTVLSIKYFHIEARKYGQFLLSCIGSTVYGWYSIALGAAYPYQLEFSWTLGHSIVYVMGAIGIFLLIVKYFQGRSFVIARNVTNRLIREHNQNTTGASS